MEDDGRVDAMQFGGTKEESALRTVGLLSAAGVACAQGWLPLVGLIADGYRGGQSLGEFAGPTWFGTSFGLLLVCCGWFARYARRNRRGVSGRGWAGGSLPSVVLACTLVGFMALVAMRGVGVWEGPTAPFWKTVVFIGSALSSGAAGMLATLWLERADNVLRGRHAGFSVLSGVVFALVLTLACAAASAIGSSQWMPCFAATLSVVSFALLDACNRVAVRASDGDNGLGATEVSPSYPHIDVSHGEAPGEAGVLGSTSTSSDDVGPRRDAPIPVSARPLLAGLLLGGCVSLMMGQFLGCAHGVASPYTWLFGLAGVALGLFAQITARQLRGDWDPFVACWVVAAAFVVAFYPMDAGSDFSLKFAVSMTTLALWSAAAVVPAVIVAFAAADGRAVMACRMSFALGCVTSVSLGGPSGYLVASTPIEGQFVLVSAICAMIASFVSLTLVLNRSLGLRRDTAGRESNGCVRDGAVEPLGCDVGMDVDAGGRGTAAGIEASCSNLARVYGLTPRELDVLLILAQGYDVARVQDELGISEGTALTHKRHIYQKLDVHTRADLLDRVRMG